MGEDVLERRAKIISAYPATRYLVDRIIELEDSAHNYAELAEELKQRLANTNLVIFLNIEILGTAV